MRIIVILFASLLTSCVVKSVDIQPNEIGVNDSGSETLPPGNHSVPFYKELTVYEVSEQAIRGYSKIIDQKR